MKTAGLPALEKKLATVMKAARPDIMKMNRLILEHYEIPETMWGEMSAKVSETLTSKAIDQQDGEEAA